MFLYVRNSLEAFILLKEKGNVIALSISVTNLSM